MAALEHKLRVKFSINHLSAECITGCAVSDIHQISGIILDLLESANFPSPGTIP
jgi:hypothetical protein